MTSDPDDDPAGVPCWVEAVQPDPRAALEFYGPLLGWTFSAAGERFVARIEGRDVAGIGALPDLGGPAAWSTWIRVDRAEAAVERAVGAGGSLVLGPLETLGGGRWALLADPAGAPFGVCEAGGRAGAQLVNAPGTWTMSSLHTPDPDGAAAFYGAVFGWRSEPMTPGAPVTRFRRPGYVGGEPGQPMPRDVVAVMTGTGGSAVPPHWNVNLRVEDADAVAAHAADLGGAVLLPPTDTPGFRSAVLLDPQGAAFSVSHVLPGA